MAVFKRRIVNKTKELCERLISKARAIIDSINSWVKRVRKHKAYIREIEESTPTYEPEMVDIKLAEELKTSLDIYFTAACLGMIVRISAIHKIFV